MKQHKKIIGFTLIEVLIALCIISIALLGVIKVSHDHLKAAEYLKQKTLAHWVGLQAIYAIQLDLIALPIHHLQTKMLDQNFVWSANLSKTTDPHINKMVITVLDAQGHLIEELHTYTLKPQ